MPESSKVPETSKEESKPAESSSASSEEHVDEPSGELLQPLVPEQQIPIPQLPSNNLMPHSIYEPQEVEISAAEKLHTVQINMNESTVLDADKLIRIKEGDKKLQLNMSNSITWSIDLASIQDMENLNVNMAVTMGKADVPKDVIATVTTEEHFELMTLEHEGEFGFEAVLSVPVKEEYVGMVANLFYYNPKTGELEFVGASRVSSTGHASFEMNHASEYVIVFANDSMATVLNEAVVEETSSSEPDTTETINEEMKKGPNATSIVIIIAVILLLASIIAAAMVFVKKRKEDYFFDEEDDPDDVTIK